MEENDNIAPLHRQTLAEARAMAEYALASGLAVTASAVQIIDSTHTAEDLGNEEQTRRLVEAHAELTRLVAPATPRMLTLLASQPGSGKKWKAMATIPLVRRLLGAAVVSLVSFIAISLSPYLNDPRYSNIFAAEGLPLLINELFFLSAAALGASFAGLFEASRYVSRGTYDPRYDSTYWTKLFLGIIAGFIMAAMIHVSGDPGDQNGQDSAAHLVQGMQAAGMALLGGFSSSAVHRILFRLVEAMEAVVTGGAEGRISQERANLKSNLDTRVAQERVQLAGQLNLLQSQLADADLPDEARDRLTRLMQELSSKPGAAPLSLPAAQTPAAEPTPAPDPDESPPPDTPPEPNSQTP